MKCVCGFPWCHSQLPLSAGHSHVMGRGLVALFSWGTAPQGVSPSLAGLEGYISCVQVLPGSCLPWHHVSLFQALIERYFCWELIACISITHPRSWSQEHQDTEGSPVQTDMTCGSRAGPLALDQEGYLTCVLQPLVSAAAPVFLLQCSAWPSHPEPSPSSPASSPHA